MLYANKAFGSLPIVFPPGKYDMLFCTDTFIL